MPPIQTGHSTWVASHTCWCIASKNTICWHIVPDHFIWVVLYSFENSGAWNCSLSFGNSGIKSIFYNCWWHSSRKGNSWMTFPSEMKTDQPFCLNIAWSLKFQFGWHDSYWFLPYVSSSIPTYLHFLLLPLYPSALHARTPTRRQSILLPMWSVTHIHQNKSLKHTSKKKKVGRFWHISLRLLDVLSIKFMDWLLLVCRQAGHVVIFYFHGWLVTFSQETHGPPVRENRSPFSSHSWRSHLYPQLSGGRSGLRPRKAAWRTHVICGGDSRPHLERTLRASEHLSSWLRL